ncbi:ATP-binding protein [Streptomyces sp. NPDC019890]|uniref:ATP-binding protein n=1 Tax=Streptomyces sp. NPDC019890 TaxID=3365064 RepID=UPI00384B614D
MPCEPQFAARARGLVVKPLAALGLAHLADIAELLVSELVGNAMKYADGRTLLITVRPADCGARVAVAVGSRSLPTLIRAGDKGEGGCCLALVGALARRWGAVLLPRGTRVWFEL